jgi:hypothetical protein
MNTSKNAESTTTTTPAKDACCNIDIQIESKGDVNIYNCTTAPSSSGEPCPPPKNDHVCPPVAPGACVPASLGAKPKQSRRRKLDKLLANTRVPSALGASFFHMARRFLAGKTAANALEERAFARLRRLSPDLRRVLACALDSFDSLSVGERDRLFASDLVRDVNQPITIAQLTDAFAQEIIDNVSVQVFDDPGCTTEHPGQVRTPPHPGGEFPPAPVVVCRINGLRTGQFRPPLALGDYTPEEVQQLCHVVLEGNQSKLVCEVQTTNCPGTDLGGLCLRVQDIEAGTAVLLEGMNFSSVDTKVRLTNVETPTTVREVDAHVCGDDETPRTEIINATEVLITDCRVHDRLTFRVPDDLPPGRYDITVMVPNVVPVPVWGDVLFSNGERGINVIPSSAARFQIASETLHCINETGSTSIGSDEVGIKILAVPLFPDLTSGEVQVPNGGEPIRFDDVDSGETRGMDHLLFTHQQPIAGAALSILGFEVDGEDAFENQIDSFTEAFIDILKDQIAFLKDHLKEVGAIVEKLAEKGLAGAIAAAIAIAVVLAIDVFVALWAPADLIIEDAIGPTTLELVELTSVNFPLPLPSEHVTPQGIKVKVTPLEKIPQQYREKREYASDDEESRYEIVLRYNRLA